MTDITDTKAALTAAFKELRKQGMVARQNYLCCRSCAGAAMATEENKGKGAAYYTRQDAESFRSSGQVYLGFGVISGDDPSGEETRRVGQNIVAILERHGLDVEWNGSEHTRILVKGMQPPPPDATYLDLYALES